MAALTDKGELYTWGFGVYGQLGHDSYESEYEVRKVEVCNVVDEGVEYVVEMPTVTKVKCSYYSTFCIDGQGRLFAWGKG